MNTYALIILAVIGSFAPCNAYIKAAFNMFRSDKSSLWQKKNLIDKISYRLIKKSWSPKSVKYEDDAIIPEYPGSPEEAARILHEEKDYEFHEQTAAKSELLFTVLNEEGRPEYDPNMESILFVHPISGTAVTPFTASTVTAFAMRNLQKNYNIFAVEAPKLETNRRVNVLRTVAKKQTYYDIMGSVMSTLLVKGVALKHLRPEQIHVIGHSYSGELVAYMARYMEFVFQKKVASVLGLDPFSSSNNRHLTQISRDDARVVYVFHSGSYIYGSRSTQSTADFFFNDGMLQPECSFRQYLSKIHKKIWSEPYMCSHERCVTRFWYAFLYPSKHLFRRCATWQRFNQCLCDNNDVFTVSYPPKSDDLPNGVYYMKTGAQKPYGMAEEGTRCPPGGRDRLRQAELRRLQSELSVTIT